MQARYLPQTLFACGAALLLAGAGLLTHPSPGVTFAEDMAEIEPFTDVACLECHTDQARLDELAVVEEAPEEPLSSGPG